MRVGLILVAFIFSLSGFSQTDWKTFPKTGEKEQGKSVGKEAILSDTMQASQSTQGINDTSGTLEITVSPEIIELDDMLKEAAKNDSRIKGFTLLIFSGSGANSKLNAHQKQTEFKNLYPDYISHLAWKSPNYEVRVGNFRTKIEAEKVLQEIKRDYPSAIVRADLIELPELKKTN